MDQAQGLRERLKSPPPISPTDGEGPGAKVRSGGDGLRVIAVTSGKGGVGKTNVTANLAVLLARQGKRVLVIDADLGLANVEIIFGVKPRHHIGDLLSGAHTIDEVLAEGPLGIKILPAGSGVQSLTQLTDEQKQRLLASFDGLEDRFDVVFIDSGAGIGDNVLFFVGAAQEALLVVSPEPTSLVDAYAVVKVLSQQAGVRDFGVVVNPVVDELAARDIFPKLTTVTNRFLDARVQHLGYVPRDENMHRSIMARTPIVELFPMSPASRALGEVAKRLLERKPQRNMSGGLKFMWQRLFAEAAGGG